MSDGVRNRIAGDVAISVAVAATRPLREACERLALLVDGLERFVTTSMGPSPYPYKSLQVLRNDLTDAYLQASAAARPCWADARGQSEMKYCISEGALRAKTR